MGMLIMVIEPMTGTRILRRSFRQDDASGGVDAGGGVVRKDPRAIAATNEWHASKAEIFNSILLVLLEVSRPDNLAAKLVQPYSDIAVGRT